MSDDTRTALVTGAGGSIGEAVAVRLAELGHRVLLLDKNVEKVTELAHRIGELAVPLACDLAQVSEIEGVVSSVDRGFGGVDILVNNAGVLSNNKIAETEMSEWRWVNQINLDAAFELTKGVLPTMRRKKWGRIVNMSSYAAKSGGLTAGTAYTVTKSAIIGLTFSTAREVAREGITANAIAPCYVTSRMVTEQLTEEQRRAQLADIPVGRFCEPREVAHAVEFLASPLSGFITGEVLDMNGGFHFD
ncbi:MAG: SDR family NAD(P)-dependent oxidoreductase [Pseudomonadota bacterium]